MSHKKFRTEKIVVLVTYQLGSTKEFKGDMFIDEDLVEFKLDQHVFSFWKRDLQRILND